MVDVPVFSSYSPVMAEAVEKGPRVGIIASVPATLRDSEYYLLKAAEEKGLSIEPKLCLAEDLIPVLRKEGESGFSRRIAEEVTKLEPNVDSEKVDILWQFPGRTEAVQVKSSQNPFGKADVERWAGQLEAWQKADEYRLVLVGTGSSSVSKLG